MESLLLLLLQVLLQKKMLSLLSVSYSTLQEKNCRKTVMRSGVKFQHYFTALSAYSFLVFNLLCAPCFAAMGAIKREMNSAKWTLFAIGYQCVFAYAVSLIIYQVGSIFYRKRKCFRFNCCTDPYSIYYIHASKTV